MRMDSGVSLHNASSHGWIGECVDLDCHHSGSRGVMQSPLNRHSCVCWSITWVGARVQHHLFFQLVAELEGRSLLIPPSQDPVFNWVGLF
ncbi:unnamed protein product [Sphagnum troendelagicum]|uniref:Uncharacterized protein n=1 Tax=Sphagnum jensenii TaxID=128206 RepID=A0ABP0WXV4_9BRYO